MHQYPTSNSALQPNIMWGFVSVVLRNGPLLIRLNSNLPQLIFQKTTLLMHKPSAKEIRGWKVLAALRVTRKNQMEERCNVGKQRSPAQRTKFVFCYHGAAGRIWCHIMLQVSLLSHFPYGVQRSVCCSILWMWMWTLCACVRMIRFAVKSVSSVISSVCGVDESSPRRAGRTGCHGLQVRSHRGKETILLLGGPAVVCYQAAHQLPLQGDLFMFILVAFQRSHVEIWRFSSLGWSVSLFKLNKTVLSLFENHEETKIKN